MGSWLSRCDDAAEAKKVIDEADVYTKHEADVYTKPHPHPVQVSPTPAPSPDWTIDFDQPNANYMNFRNTLFAHNVSLESASVYQNKLLGTVKVNNLGFEKAVYVRTTRNDWTTFDDVTATFMPNWAERGSMIDTFSFEIPLGQTSDGAVEFCILFVCGGVDYWDNNGDKNYRVTLNNAQNQDSTMVRNSSR